MTQKYDPSKLFVSSRLLRDKDEHGVVVNDDGLWESGKLHIDLFDAKSGLWVTGIVKEVTRRKYEAFREDFDTLSTAEVIDEFFADLNTGTPSKTELQKADEKAQAETAKREKVAKKEAKKEVEKQTEEATQEDLAEPPKTEDKPSK